VCLWIQYKLYQHASVTNIYIYKLFMRQFHLAIQPNLLTL